jgi:MinD superfamily P-loop ATPase
MRIAVASGKGGTGKTTVATNLAAVAARAGRRVGYLDCDVEEPNGHIFLKPKIEEVRPVGSLVPRVDAGTCTQCGECGQICQFRAIAGIGRHVLVFPELCHSCGGCSLVCAPGAIAEVLRETGRLEIGRAGSIRFVHGIMNVGEAMSPPLIRAVKAEAPDGALVVLDAPPGTSCPVVESIRGSDFVLLVTEPTPFGLHDLAGAVQVAGELSVPVGIVVNRADIGNRAVHRYAHEHGIVILAEIPDDRRVAEAYSRGELVCDAVPSYGAVFARLLQRVLEVAEDGNSA